MRFAFVLHRPFTYLIKCPSMMTLIQSLQQCLSLNCIHKQGYTETISAQESLGIEHVTASVETHRVLCLFQGKESIFFHENAGPGPVCIMTLKTFFISLSFISLDS